ncbi:tenascin [Musca domestica]|uniref:Tenascin n=1 Tax=Musca domestica TaxID=7370 RepID=A0A1I8N9T2_MUSDO|nr:tenascin [Musca domestica]
MKYFLVLCTIVVLHVLDFPCFADPEPYCIYNRTEYTYVNVTKTREVKVTQPWYKKLSKKTKIEEYVEQEAIAKVTPVRGCCEGYEMSELEMCEPKCRKGCPQNSKCVEPEVCKCAAGYFSSLSELDGNHYCEPICERPCPAHSECVKPNECACHNGYQIAEGSVCRPHCPSGCPFQGKCVAPNLCECPAGYKSGKGTCLPICSRGDQCKNGVCVDTDKCQCNVGYLWNEENEKCEPNLNGGDSYQPLEDDHTDRNDVETTEKQPEIETDIDTFKEDIDPNQVFDEIFESTTTSTSQSEEPTQCPDDYVRYRGQCQPLKFAIDEIDCRIKPCSDPHAICTENGTCNCQEGYRMLKKAQSTGSADTTESSKPIVKQVCLTSEEYENFMANPELNWQDEDEIIEIIEEPSNVPVIFFIILGVLLMTGALIYLGLRFVRRQHEEMDVEGKQLECAYDNRVCSDAEKSVI